MEKPLAHTLAEGRRLVEAASAGTAKIAVCFQNRYNATSQAMHSLLSSGELGAVAGASATVMWQRSAEYYQDRPWRGTWAGGGGGLMMNQAIHTVDLLQWLVGDVVAVSGNASTRFLGGTIEVEDTAEFVAEHANGARSAFYATLANAFNAPVTLEVVTEKAVLSLRGDLTVTHADGRVDVIPERRSDSGGRSYWGVSHELLINDFYGRLDECGAVLDQPGRGREVAAHRQGNLPAELSGVSRRRQLRPVERARASGGQVRRALRVRFGLACARVQTIDCR